ncbi:beta-lactamase family protein [Thermoclostridium stercorarium]|uniref:serine hydrolase domain-containing protein n=1 Tax=Thermoclostridium stercorarium TaxID=1510 RepID=UPI002248D884|nr:serine hydrolase domain-containing protein [Thermoclostridium stercorarium]UZQ86965.1 beta-lactamase family protein [Thermoclostridium stercorarium]
MFTCTAVMQLIEKGLIGLDSPVSDYLPEYKNLTVKTDRGIVPAKNPMTIRHLLSMQSGLNYNLDAPSILKIKKETNNQATTRQVIAALANEPLDFEPGTHFQYSLSHDVLGAVIEVVSGQRLGEYFKKNIFEPLGMKNTGFELTPERKANMSDLFSFDMNTMTSTPVPNHNRYVLTRNYESGGAGLISTVDDYLLFLDAMCHGGTSKDGYRLLSKESIDLMRRDQLNEVSKKDFDLFGRHGYSYGLGVRTLIEKEKSGVKSPLGEFGWDGAAGAYALIDVTNNLAIFYIQHVLQCGYVYNVIHPKVRDLTYEMLGL